MTAAIFLDRDNTLISNDGDLGDPADVVLLDGVAQGLETLRTLGFELVVVTNQGGVARGRYGEQDVTLVHERLQALVGESSPLHFYYCPFHPGGTVPEYTREHPWRKPAPGMLKRALAIAREKGDTAAAEKIERMLRQSDADEGAV